MNIQAIITGSVLAMMVGCSPTSIPTGQTPSIFPKESYDPSKVEQFAWPQNNDIIPAIGEERRSFAEMLAYDAVLYGTSAVLEYGQMYAQGYDKNSAAFTGFNKFSHGRDLARPGYSAFKTPNADTLYSNAWLDLSDGPVILTVPDTGKTYFTVNFIDMYGNSTNISARTRGFGAGIYATVPIGWEGSIPADTEKFTVTTPYCWILMRVLVEDLESPNRARDVQDGFSLRAVTQNLKQDQALPKPANDSAEQYLRVLDWIIRNAGYPVTETALVYRYRALGVGLGGEAITKALSDPDIRAGVESGYAKARASLANSAGLSGYPAGTWKMPADIGAYGYNYFYRSAINTLGTGANVTTENFPFNTFVDAQRKSLDGHHNYSLIFDPPPPANFFWSLTLYDATTRELYGNSIDRYIINDRTDGLVQSEKGSIPIAIQHIQPNDPDVNWLPAPKGPYYLVIRAQGPKQALLNGEWLPPAIHKVP